MNVTLIIAVVVIVIVILIVLGLWRRRGRGEGNDKDRRLQNSSSDRSSSSSNSSEKHERSSHHPQEHNGRSKKEREKVHTANQEEKKDEFPRNQVQSGRRFYAKTDETTNKTDGQEKKQNHKHQDQKKDGQKQNGQDNGQKKVANEREVFENNFRQPINNGFKAQEIPVSNRRDNSEVVFVRNIAELFSPKEDIQAEYGVSDEQLAHMVSTFKQGKEYKERKLPINRHFDMDKYKQATQTIRESSIPQKGHGSKKGTIVGSIYRKYGKNFIAENHQGANKGDVMASITQQTQHERVMRNTQGKSSKAVLVDRK